MAVLPRVTLVLSTLVLACGEGGNDTAPDCNSVAGEEVTIDDSLPTGYTVRQFIEAGTGTFDTDFQMAGNAPTRLNATVTYAGASLVYRPEKQFPPPRGTDLPPFFCGSNIQTEVALELRSDDGKVMINQNARLAAGTTLNGVKTSQNLLIKGMPAPAGAVPLAGTLDIPSSELPMADIVTAKVEVGRQATTGKIVLFGYRKDDTASTQTAGKTIASW